jgi:hypothetical protein
MSVVIIQALRAWMGKHPIQPPTWTALEVTPLQQSIRRAFDAQTRIGWDQFFRGRLTKYWKLPLYMYYQERRPTSHISPTLWMNRTISTMWDFYNLMWNQRNEDFHGGTREELQAKALTATRTTVRRVYAASHGHVTNRQSRILHRLPVEDILSWTKSHLDAYLATAKIFLDKNIEPG